VGEGTFRDDLYYRLNVLQLRLPPLRERRADIALLAERFLRQGRAAGSGPTLSTQAVRILEAHGWAGNVRELQNAMARVAATVRTGAVSAGVLRNLLEEAPAARTFPGVPGDDERIAEALALSGGRRAEAAKRLGVSRATLWRRMRAIRAGR
jgi:transcriptional regulator with PAS, ATPase and Fis domain